MRILHSYRWRRRFIITAIVVGVAAPLIWLGLSHDRGAKYTGATGPNVYDPFYKRRVEVPFRKSDQREVRKVLAGFITSAVGRNHVESSWKYAGPQLRTGMTAKEWAKGAIPVQPFPVANKGQGTWDDVQYSYRNIVGLEVLLWPKHGSGLAPLAADVDVIKDHHGRWRVNYFMPKKYHGTPVTPVPNKQKRASRAERKARAAHGTEKHPQAISQPIGPREPAGPSRLWWALPVTLLGLAIVLPISIGLFVWIRNKRAYDSYARSRGAS